MFTLRDLLAGVVLPLLVSLATIFVGWRTTRHSLVARDSRAWIAPLAIALAFVAGWFGVFGRPDFPPLDADHWLFWLAVPVSLVCVALAWWKLSLAFQLLAAAVSLSLCTWLLMRSMLAMPRETSGFGWRELAIVVGLGMIWIVGMELFGERISARRVAAILLAVMIPASVGLMAAGCQRYGQTLGFLAAGLAGLWAIHFTVLGSSTSEHGLMLLVGVLYSGILLCSNVYSSLALWQALVLFFAPLAASAALLLRHRLGVQAMVLIELTISAAIALAAVVPSIIHALKSVNADY